MVFVFGVSIGVYTFQPALKEAAEIVQQGDTQRHTQDAETGDKGEE